MGGRRIRELTSVVQKRFGFPENSVELFAERVENRASCAMAQAESLRYKLLGGLAVRRACYGVVRFIRENGAEACNARQRDCARAEGGPHHRHSTGGRRVLSCEAHEKWVHIERRWSTPIRHRSRRCNYEDADESMAQEPAKTFVHFFA